MIAAILVSSLLLFPHLLCAIETPQSDVLTISECTVQDAEGIEVAFIGWGDGDKRIPVVTRSSNGYEYPTNIYKLRVSDEGDIYFADNYSNIYIFDRTGQQKLRLARPNVDVNLWYDIDHEGNIYLFDSRPNQAPVYIYRPDGTFIDKVTVNWGVYGALYARIEDALVYSSSPTPFYDFRRYLKNPSFHSRRRRFLPEVMWLTGSVALDEVNRKTSPVGFGIHQGAKAMGLAQDSFVAEFPERERREGRIAAHPLGFDAQERFYYLFSTHWDHSNPIFTVGVFDPVKRRAAYYRIQEMGNMTGIDKVYEQFDVDQDGNTFFIFATDKGIRVNKYLLGEMSSRVGKRQDHVESGRGE